MKHFIVAVLLCVSLNAADALSPKDEVIAAAKALGAKSNYTWRTTVVVPEDSPFKPGPTDGKTEKEGFTLVSFAFGENETRALIKGDKAAVTTPEGGWRPVAEVEKEDWPARFVALIVRDLRVPAEQAAELASLAKELKKADDVISGPLTEEGAKKLMVFRRRPGSTDPGPNVPKGQGSVKFWIKNGDLVKYEFKLEGAIDFGGNTMDVNRASTVEIKDVGSTKIQPPEAAVKKLE